MGKDNERKKDDKHKKLKIRLRANSYGIGDFKGDKKFKMSLYNLTQELITKMIEFEGAVVDSAVLNSVDWFGEDLSKEIVTHQFTGALKYEKDKKTKKSDHSRPYLGVKATNSIDEFDYKVYNEKRDQIFPNDEGKTPIDLIPPRSEVFVGLHSRGIWIAKNGKWGLNWEIDQIQVIPVPEKPQEFLFEESDEEDEEFLSALDLKDN